MKPMYSNVNNEDSDSKSSDGWDENVQGKLDFNENRLGKLGNLKAHKLKKNYLNSENSEEKSDGTYSDDIENQKRPSRGVYKDWGYKQLGSTKRNSKSIMSMG